MASATSTGSPLLDLPPEIRNKIYPLVLITNDSIRIGMHKLSRGQALLHTCSRVRSEATSIFCGENKFHFNLTNNFNHARLLRWSKSLGGRAALLTSLTLNVEETAVWDPHDDDFQGVLGSRVIIRICTKLMLAGILKEALGVTISARPEDLYWDLLYRNLKDWGQQQGVAVKVLSS